MFEKSVIQFLLYVEVVFRSDKVCFVAKPDAHSHGPQELCGNTQHERQLPQELCCNTQKERHLHHMK